MRILIVEDDEGLREGLCDLLEEHDEARSVPSAAEGLELLDQETFELVLTDLTLRGSESGLSVIRRAHERLVPAALITGNSDAEGAASEADAQLTKPFALEDVLALVDRFRRLLGAGGEPLDVTAGALSLPGERGALRVVAGELRCGEERVLPGRSVFLHPSVASTAVAASPSRFLWLPLR